MSETWSGCCLSSSTASTGTPTTSYRRIPLPRLRHPVARHPLKKQFDLILLDMVIPGIGARWKQGLDLLKRIRDLGVKAPVLMMSGDWDTRKEAEVLSAGAVGYLHKPFNLRDLDRSIALALGPRATGG